MPEEGATGYEAIAQAVGVSRVTLWHWRQRPEWQARVGEPLAGFREVALRRGVALADERARELARGGRRPPGRDRGGAVPAAQPVRIIYVNDWRTEKDRAGGLRARGHRGAGIGVPGGSGRVLGGS